MQNKFILSLTLVASIFMSAYFISCSKPSTTTPAITCADKTLVITASTTATSGGTATNGSITASATGSNGFTYNINGGAFQSSGSFSGLAAGTYSIIAKDDAGCTASKSFVVTATACPTILVTGTVTDATTTTSNNGTIVATATGSTGIMYSKDAVTFQASGTFASLAIGSFTITAKDANGCTGTKIFVISTPGCPAITVTGNATPTAGPTATNGTITATAAGGVAAYTYSKDGITFQPTGVFNNLAVNNYTIVAKDANGCLGSSANISVTSACPIITVSAITTATDKCVNTGTISITASGSTGLMYSLNALPFQTSNIFNTQAAGTYTVNVKDANGCTATTSSTVAISIGGPKFLAVKAIMTANCALSGCHAGASPQSGHNFANDCTIVLQSARIKARAVDGNPSIMPASGAISAADKQKIVDWITAGGQQSN